MKSIRCGKNNVLYYIKIEIYSIIIKTVIYLFILFVVYFIYFLFFKSKPIKLKIRFYFCFRRFYKGLDQIQSIKCTSTCAAVLLSFFWGSKKEKKLKSNRF